MGAESRMGFAALNPSYGLRGLLQDGSRLAGADQCGFARGAEAEGGMREWPGWSGATSGDHGGDTVPGFRCAQSGLRLLASILIRRIVSIFIILHRLVQQRCFD